MWQLHWRGHVVREDDLTLGEVERIERLSGLQWQDIGPGVSARAGMAIGRVILCRFLPDSEASVEAGRLRLRDWAAADDDLPATFLDGSPVDPKREVDRWIPQLCMPPFQFTPFQVRTQFSLRDLKLLMAASPDKRR